MRQRVLPMIVGALGASCQQQQQKCFLKGKGSAANQNDIRANPDRLIVNPDRFAPMRFQLIPNRKHISAPSPQTAGAEAVRPLPLAG